MKLCTAPCLWTTQRLSLPAGCFTAQVVCWLAMLMKWYIYTHTHIYSRQRLLDVLTFPLPFRPSLLPQSQTRDIKWLNQPSLKIPETTSNIIKHVAKSLRLSFHNSHGDLSQRITTELLDLRGHGGRAETASVHWWRWRGRADVQSETRCRGAFPVMAHGVGQRPESIWKLT